jgi:glycogen debranching enzyme
VTTAITSVGEESAPVPAATLTLVRGASFLICDGAGDISGSGIEGLFVADTRVCSRLVLTINGVNVDALTVAQDDPSTATFIGRTSDRTLVVFRDLSIDGGMRAHFRLRNVSTTPQSVLVQLEIDADLADVLAIKKGEAIRRSTTPRVADGTVRFATEDESRGVVASGEGATIEPRGALCWGAIVPPRGEWAADVMLSAERGGALISKSAGGVAATTQAAHHDVPRFPRVESDALGLTEAIARTHEDLRGLELFDPDHPDERLVAAGAPWYMTLFGRDSLLTSFMAMIADPALALFTVRALARLQGHRHDPTTGEQPGRILHEVRFSPGASLAFADGIVHYGTVDATPLFVMVVHELWRWGTPLGELESLLPAVDAAIDWMRGDGDPDGDGYLEYSPSTGAGMLNQGWKDSADSISFANGDLADPPIALAEVQAYAYAAFRAGAALSAASGDHRQASARAASADALSAQFIDDFWLPDQQAIALALDRNKRPVDSIASNMGHCLWTGIVSDHDKAACVARWLASPELFSGWGVRTLATSMARYNPLSYHNGSAWPHDTAICMAGLRRAGFVDEAMQLAEGLLAAAHARGNRLPELFAGLAPADAGVPVPYPASCVPQAWASAAPLLVLRALLGLEPDVPNGCLELDPLLPPHSTRLRLVDIPLGTARVSIEIERDAVAVRRLPRGLALIRPPL